MRLAECRVEVALDGAKHVGRRGAPVDAREHRRERARDRVAVLAERRDARAHLLLRVVRALLEPREQRGVVRRRRLEREVVDLAGRRVGAPADDALDEQVLGHVELHERVQKTNKRARRWGLSITPERRAPLPREPAGGARTHAPAAPASSSASACAAVRGKPSSSQPRLAQSLCARASTTPR